MFLHKTSRMLHPICPRLLEDVNKCFCDPKDNELYSPVCPKLQDRNNECYCEPEKSYETKKTTKKTNKKRSKRSQKKSKLVEEEPIYCQGEMCTDANCGNVWAMVKITTDSDGEREFEILEVYKNPPGKYDKRLFNGKSSVRISNNQVVWALAKVTTECDDTKVFEILEVSNDPPDRYLCADRGNFVVLGSKSSTCNAR